MSTYKSFAVVGGGYQSSQNWLPAIRGLQKPLVDAAKLAGVKLFVPDELATPTDSEPAGSHNPVAGIGDKAEVAEYLKSQNIPSARTFTGLFIDSIAWLVVFRPQENQNRAFPTESDVIVMLTIPGFVARILTTLPPSGLENLFNTSVEHLDRIPGEAGSTGRDEANKVEKTGSDGAGSANTLWSGYKWGSTREVLHL
ncbi:hypothetical protein DFH06DRAFT_1344201 [Mycena polygramma]|nr:hypothetical protein DFH06DRAFT_1344201 [Mycena polygramma]